MINQSINQSRVFSLLIRCDQSTLINWWLTKKFEDNYFSTLGKETQQLIIKTVRETLIRNMSLSRHNVANRLHRPLVPFNSIYGTLVGRTDSNVPERPILPMHKRRSSCSMRLVVESIETFRIGTVSAFRPYIR
jgi:hypothetical protein